VQLIEQILSEKENPRRDHSLITIPHAYFFERPMEDNLYLELKQILAVLIMRIITIAHFTGKFTSSWR
jgi:hypothetical protein